MSASGHIARTHQRSPGRWAKGRRRYRVFSCAAHVGHLDQPRAMSDDDRAELAHRREQWAKAKAGQQFERVQPIR